MYITLILKMKLEQCRRTSSPSTISMKLPFHPAMLSRYLCIDRIFTLAGCCAIPEINDKSSPKWKEGGLKGGSLQAAARQMAQTIPGMFWTTPSPIVLFLQPGVFRLPTVHLSENQYGRKKIFKKPFFQAGNFIEIYVYI